MAKIELYIECRSCNGTGVYIGMAERDGAAVVCRTCKGAGKEHFVLEYTEFTGRKLREDVKRVYLSGHGYVIAPRQLDVDGIGRVDLGAEGVSYDEFLSGKLPTHIKALGCPMMADQLACHAVKGFTDKCHYLNGGWLSYIPRCANRANMAECWGRFEEARDV